LLYELNCLLAAKEIILRCGTLGEQSSPPSSTSLFISAILLILSTPAVSTWQLSGNGLSSTGLGSCAGSSSARRGDAGALCLPVLVINTSVPNSASQYRSVFSAEVEVEPARLRCDFDFSPLWRCFCDDLLFVVLGAGDAGNWVCNLVSALGGNIPSLHQSCRTRPT
jgi:hypothetical protein